MFTDCTIAGNSAGTGGGIDGGGTLTDCTISGNKAQDGGGLYGSGQRSRLPTAPSAGTPPRTAAAWIIMTQRCSLAVRSAETPPSTLVAVSVISRHCAVDCTVSGNSAQGDGGGLFNQGTFATLSVYGCTISVDSGQSGGGLYCYSGSANLIDTIVAGNTKTGGDIAGKRVESVTGSFNLIGTGGWGGIVGGTDGNIVLTSLTGLDLGHSAIMAGPPRPWPCSPAAPPSARASRLKQAPVDQRGEP